MIDSKIFVTPNGIVDLGNNHPRILRPLGWKTGTFTTDGWG